MAHGAYAPSVFTVRVPGLRKLFQCQARLRHSNFDGGVAGFVIILFQGGNSLGLGFLQRSFCGGRQVGRLESGFQLQQIALAIGSRNTCRSDANRGGQKEYPGNVAGHLCVPCCLSVERGQLANLRNQALETGAALFPSLRYISIKLRQSPEGAGRFC